MHKLKTYVSESVMCGKDSFSSWLLIPSRPDEKKIQPRCVFAQFRNGEIWNDKWVLPASFCVCRNHVEILSEREGGGHRERKGGGQRERGG